MAAKLAVLLAVAGAANAALSCKNMQGKDVDWFMAYKLPSGTTDSPNGFGFAYLDRANPTWTISSLNIDNPKSAIGATITQIKNEDDSMLYGMWNDDPPNTDKAEAYRGHTKGMIAFDANNGFWIQHSMPNFPNPPNMTYTYPDTATKYGQTLICLSFKAANLNDIIEQLRYMMISPYAFYIPSSFDAKYPNVTGVIENRDSLNTRKEKVFSSVKDLKTAGGQVFTSFAKHKKFNADLWANLVAPAEKAPMAVESWLNGAAKNYDSLCSTNVTVYDIASIDLEGNTFKSSKDHSKWGASENAATPVICVGDINRQQSQAQRGGGALCIVDKKIWQPWNEIIASRKPC